MQKESALIEYGPIKEGNQCDRHIVENEELGWRVVLTSTSSHAAHSLQSAHASYVKRLPVWRANIVWILDSSQPTKTDLT